MWPWCRSVAFSGVNCGHYTAYTRHWSSGDWYHYNDEAACKQAPQREDHANAYILFYQRKGAGSTGSFAGGSKGCCVPLDKSPTSPDDGSSGSAATGLGPDAIQRILCQLESPLSPKGPVQRTTAAPENA